MKQNSMNTDVTINADGFSIAGGTTPRALGVTGADLAFIASGTGSLTLPAAPATIPASTDLHTQNTDTGTTAAGFKLDTGNTGPQIINNGGVMEIKNAAGDAYADLKCKDLTVSGTTTTVNSETVTVDDNIIVLNANEAGTPSVDAGIEVERGTLTNAQLLWNETADRFQAGLTGALETLAYQSEIPTGDTAEELTGDKTAEINHTYITNKAGTACAITLPAAAVVGSELKIIGKGATGWTLLQAAGQQVHFGNVSTTAGAGGSLASSATRDCISLICVIADTTWQVFSSVGNITVV